MTLPKREYFYLQEVAQKLEITEFDLQYYLSHGDILACTWVEGIFEKSIYDAFRDKYLPPALQEYTGYVTLSPEDCREVFIAGHIHSHQLFLDYYEIRLTVPEDRQGTLIRRDALMISVWDLEAFAEQHISGEGKERNTTGRPSLMRKIMEEHVRRINANESCKNRTQEAWTLRNWAELHLKDQPIPSQKTIYNELIKKSRRQQSEGLKTVA